MLKETADLLTEEKVGFFINENYRDHFFRKKTRKHHYEIGPLNLFTMIRISKEVLNIDKSLFNKKLIPASMDSLAKHGESLIKIVAYSVLNADEKPSKKLMGDISLLNAIELVEVVGAILKQMNLQPFMTSIISISGVNLIEMNPKEQGS